MKWIQNILKNNFRQRAEKLLKKNQKRKVAVSANTGNYKLIHELEVYRVELEMQNEELRNAYSNAEILAQKYRKLYDFAPSGYLSINKKGKITELNLISAHMLGKNRSELTNIQFEQLVSSKFKADFKIFLNQIFENNIKETCELEFNVNNSHVNTYFLTGIVNSESESCEITMIDISKLKQAELVLENLENQKRNLVLKTVLDGYWMIDNNGCVLETNDAYCRMSGYDAKEVIGKHISFLHPEMSTIFIADFIQAVKYKGIHRFDYQLNTKSGGFFETEINAQFLDENGGCILVFLHDIAERKQIEFHLKQREESYMSLFHENNSVIIIIDSDTGEIIDVNPAACAYFGWSKDDLCQKKIYEINQKYPVEIKEWLRTDSQERNNHLYAKYKLADGEIRDVEVYSGTIFLFEKKLVYQIVHDITESISAEETLKENECLLRQSQQAANVGSYSFDFINRTWKGTDELHSILGIDNSYPHTFEAWAKLIHPDSASYLTEKRYKYESNKQFNSKFKIIRFNDKNVRWVLGLGTFEFDDDMNPVSLIGTVQDITNLKKTEDELAKLNDELEERVIVRTAELVESNDNLALAEKKYRTVADFAYGWEFWLDKNENFNYCSPACERITGHKAECFINNPNLITDIIHPDDLHIYQKHCATERGKFDASTEIKYRIIRSDGEIRWIGHYCQTLNDENGNYIGVRGSNQDITKRIEMEQLVHISNQKYKLLSDNTTDGIFIWKNERFEYVNPEMCKIFEISEPELLNLSFEKLFLTDYQEEIKKMLTMNSSENVNLSYDAEFLYKDLTVGYIELILNYVASENSVFGVVHDFTEKKKYHVNIIRTIIQTEERERLNFSKELHDGLGPLLSTIKLYLQWAERSEIKIKREEIVKKAYEVLEESIQTVKEISYKLSPHILENYGLIVALKNYIDRLNETIDVQIKFESNVTERLNSVAETTIYRALIECLNNTLKYAEAHNIYINLYKNHNSLQINYKDDGKGFDIKNSYNKNGLGLYNLQSRINNLGGKISLKSEPNKGVDYEFIIKLTR